MYADMTWWHPNITPWCFKYEVVGLEDVMIWYHVAMIVWWSHTDDVESPPHWGGYRGVGAAPSNFYPRNPISLFWLSDSDATRSNYPHTVPTQKGFFLNFIACLCYFAENRLRSSNFDFDPFYNFWRPRAHLHPAPLKPPQLSDLSNFLASPPYSLATPALFPQVSTPLDLGDDVEKGKGFWLHASPLHLGPTISLFCFAHEQTHTQTLGNRFGMRVLWAFVDTGTIVG